MSLPKGSRWDGTPKGWTKNCETCEYHVEIEEKHYCGAGVAYKELVQVEKPKGCVILGRKPEYRSVEFLVAHKKKLEQERTAYVFAYRDQGVHLGIQLKQSAWSQTIIPASQNNLHVLSKQGKRLCVITREDELPLEHELDLVIPMPDRLQRIVTEAHQCTGPQ
jgi:hypothetical protein